MLEALGLRARPGVAGTLVAAEPTTERQAVALPLAMPILHTDGRVPETRPVLHIQVVHVIKPRQPPLGTPTLPVVGQLRPCEGGGHGRLVVPDVADEATGTTPTCPKTMPVQERQVPLLLTELIPAILVGIVSGCRAV